ncbi:hypothetical protein SPRG_02216 [Saprolegnia parasitica CBS 223.65]|uniref:FAR1 domain-containing protein n=1 Tax=Saprolegnia parasitica (strain CBS 223.65) TaxID=695850 RepID=A0A067CRR4_SAPPC|nr:hypothetical protein SPRG_02216 [Saprolegnia parasitica CBS 223.65]KDO33409.1 hypothetical protein SPRG_02216 [Saprolegnia parasitica CBS 223.65]|eukprot:XP_012196157.1 hypothetical protein SPRG_02216 [Saprolegnia parasitica CBS 223.65]
MAPFAATATGATTIYSTTDATDATPDATTKTGATTVTTTHGSPDATDVDALGVRLRFTFDNAEKYVDNVQQFGRRFGFEACKDGKKVNGRSSAAVRATHMGKLVECKMYCNWRDPRKEGLPRGIKHRSDCMWVLKFRYYPKEKVYRVYEANLNHAHTLHNMATNANGMVLVQCEKDFLPDELALLEKLAVHAIPTSTVREILERDFRGRHYDDDLLHRVLKRVQVAHFGSDEHAISVLFQEGNHIREAGGVFNFELDYTTKLKSMCVQV